MWIPVATETSRNNPMEYWNDGAGSCRIDLICRWTTE